MTSDASPALSTNASKWLQMLTLSDVDHAIIFFDLEGRVVEWLGAAQRLFGYSASEALGLPFSTLFTPEDLALRLDAHELALARSAGRSEDDRWHMRQDGSRFWASGVLALLRDEAGAPLTLCKVVRDRTDVRIQVRNLENQLAARLADIKRLSLMSATTVHEMRNHMMPVMSAVALFERTGDDQLRTQACEVVQRHAAVLKRLVDDWSQATGGAPPAALIRPERTSVQDALRTSADSVRAEVDAHGLVLRMVLPEKDVWIDVDRLRLQQIMLNLLGNAIKYTPAGGAITLSASVEADMAVVRVEDTGRGIAPEMLPNIFELFTREERGVPLEGMGVGLAVVKDLARRHGGNVEARSAGVDKGSCFGLRLPLSPTA